MLLTIGLSVVLFREEWRRLLSAPWRHSCRPEPGLFKWFAYLRNGFKSPTSFDCIKHWLAHHATRTMIVSFVVLALILPIALTSAPLATAIWFGNALMLTLFFFSLVVAKSNRISVISWFILSLLPHVAVGLVQYYLQDAFGSTYLGMADHRPWLLGTSVVEHGLYRVLRAYGGFPHPNIFGGWLAIALTLFPFLIPTQSHPIRRMGLYLVGALFAFALVFTYSRSAWIATVVGMFACIFWLWRSWDEADRLRLVSFFMIIVASVAVSCYINWDHVSARFHPEQNRLEAWSLESRDRASYEGMGAFNRRQVVGWGPGSSLLASVVERSSKINSHPILLFIEPEPVHSIPQVLLVETGLIGFAGVLVLLFFALRFCSRVWKFSIGEKKWSIWVPHPVFIVLLALACFDHYLWTTWAGQSLLMMTVLMGGVEEKGVGSRE